MANPTLQDVIEAIQDKVIATGIKYAPDYAPSTLPGQWPAVITYPTNGRAVTGDAGIAYYLHNIHCSIHYPPVDFSNTIKILVPYIETIITAITDDPWLSNNCEPFTAISYVIGPMKYAEMDTMGIRFTIENVKLYPYGKQ